MMKWCDSYTELYFIIYLIIILARSNAMSVSVMCVIISLYWTLSLLFHDEKNV